MRVWFGFTWRLSLGIVATLAGGYLGAVIGSHIVTKPHDDDDIGGGLSVLVGAVAGGLAGLILTGVAVVGLFFWLGRRAERRDMGA